MTQEYGRFDSISNGDIGGYTPGGFHPLLVGDELKDGRYKIIHNLGEGGSAIVWLAQDTLQETYVAIKVLQALVSKFTQEVAVHHYLSRDPDFASASISKIRDRFIVKGINGRHVCLVFDIHGISLRNLSQTKFRPDYARDIAKQVTGAIAFLHRNGVAFGDLSLANILLDCVDFSSFSKDELYKVTGKPAPEEIYCRSKDKSLAKHAPKWFYPSTNFACFSLDFLKPRIVLTDLGEAQHVTALATDDGFGIDYNYASPEYLLEISDCHTKASDIWALAYIFYCLRAKSSMVRYSSTEEISGIQYLIGPPPTDVCEMAKTKMSDPDEVQFITEEEFANGKRTIRDRLQDIGDSDWEPWNHMTRDERREYLQAYLSVGPQDRKFDIEAALDTGPPPPARLSDEELTDLYDLLSKMLVWEPEKRLTIDQVLAHPWLHKKYNDLDEPSEHWIERYNTGCTNYGVTVVKASNFDSQDNGEEATAIDPKADDLETSDLEGSAVEGGRVFFMPASQKPEGEYDRSLRTLTPTTVEYVEDSDDSDDDGDNEDYFVTRLLGLPVPKSGNAEDIELIELQDLKPLLEVSERSGDLCHNDEYFVTRLLGLPIPKQEDIEDTETIATEHSLVSIEDLEQPRTPGNNDGYFVTRLLGLPTPQSRDVEVMNASD